MQPSILCDGICECDEAGYCTKQCSSKEDCACGERCYEGKCRTECTSKATCSQGQICQNNICKPGCRLNSDCPNELSCFDKKCQDPCQLSDACGTNAVCRVSNHRKVCLCPDGYQGEPTKICLPYECHTDNDCETNKKCLNNGACSNPCLEEKVCGINAQCKVVNREAHCSCPPGYIGNPQTECKQSKGEECSKNPCGENASCRDVTPGVFECVCLPGCAGDAYQGCICENKLINLCKSKLCGVKAQCRVVNGKEAQCYCPSEFPHGDPTIECK